MNKFQWIFEITILGRPKDEFSYIFSVDKIPQCVFPSLEWNVLSNAMAEEFQNIGGVSFVANNVGESEYGVVWIVLLNQRLIVKPSLYILLILERCIIHAMRGDVQYVSLGIARHR